MKTQFSRIEIIAVFLAALSAGVGIGAKLEARAHKTEVSH